jgi:hypothetical protein
VTDKIYVFDAPGVLEPNYEDKNVIAKLALLGSVRQDILPLVALSDYLLDFLKVHYKENLLARYGNLDFDVEDDEENGNREILADCFDVANRDEYLNTNERLKLYITKEGFLRYYVYRTVEKPNSKIRQLGYTPDEVVDWIVGVEEREAELEEFKKETNEKAISMLADSLGIDKEEARELFNKEQEENINKDE